MKKIFKYILWALLAGIVIYTFVFLYQKSRPAVTTFSIEEAEFGTIENRTVATGRIEPRYEILIKPQMSGIISEVYKRAGDIVRTGDIIARIQVIPDMVSLNTAESRLNRARLAFEQTSRVFERDSQLFERGIISREDFEKSQLRFDSDREELQTAQENLSLIRDGISSNRSMVTNTLVRSTIDGMILNIPVKVGNSVIQSNNFNDGTTIASIADMSDMLFVGRMDETEVGRLRIGMPMEITIGALQDVNLEATLEFVSPQGVLDGGAVMFEMKAALNVPDTLFVRAGFSANANILLQSVENVLTIPEKCLEFSNDSIFVYRLITEQPQEFERHPVQIGLSDGIRVQILEGLSENDRIRGTEIRN